MNRSELSAERARELLAYDHETGLLTWRVNKGRARAGSRAGTPDKDGYLTVKVQGVTLKVHRIAFLLVEGEWPRGEVDHLNGVKSDNRYCNLRLASRSENMQNERRARFNSKTGVLGVTLCHGKPQASLYANGTKRYLGQFRTVSEAHQAYLTAKRQLHSGCTI